jgi:hypothetical protein
MTSQRPMTQLSSEKRPPYRRNMTLDLVRHLAKAIFDSYRPERHYMRGPGPKWHARAAGVA